MLMHLPACSQGLAPGGGRGACSGGESLLQAPQPLDGVGTGPPLPSDWQSSKRWLPHQIGDTGPAAPLAVPPRSIPRPDAPSEHSSTSWLQAGPVYPEGQVQMALPFTGLVSQLEPSLQGLLMHASFKWQSRPGGAAPVSQAPPPTPPGDDQPPTATRPSGPVRLTIPGSCREVRRQQARPSAPQPSSLQKGPSRAISGGSGCCQQHVPGTVRPPGGAGGAAEQAVPSPCCLPPRAAPLLQPGAHPCGRGDTRSRKRPRGRGRWRRGSRQRWHSRQCSRCSPRPSSR